MRKFLVVCLALSVVVGKPTFLPEDDALPGGFRTLEANNVDDYVKEVASFAANALSSSVNSPGPVELVRIISAEKQVVAGLNYSMKLELKSADEFIICDVNVWEQSWINSRSLTQATCSARDQVA